MANKKFFVDIDLYKNQLLNAVLHSGDTATLAGILSISGQVGYDTELGRISYSGLTGIETLMESVESGFGSYTGSTLADAKSASIKAIYDYYSSTTTGEGASVIGIEDPNGYYTSDDIEGALNEIGESLESIGSSMEVVGIIDATGGTIDRTYPTTGDITKSGATDISAGDAFLVVGNQIGDFSGDTGTYVLMGPSDLWVSSGSLIVARLDNATDADSDWFILDARRGFSSETAAGLISLATQTEVNEGTNDTKAITPLKLKAILENNDTASIYTELNVTGLTSGSIVTHNLGSDIVSQVWLNNEEITSGVNLVSAENTVTLTTNVDPGTVIKVVVIGKKSYGTP
jgi:hypothetical protein